MLYLRRGGMVIVENENNEPFPTRTVTGWPMCINYRKLNKASCKDHFPLLFIDEVLERLAKNSYFCYLDGYSGFSKSLSTIVTKKIPPLLVHMIHLLIGECHLGCVMPPTYQ